MESKREIEERMKEKKGRDLFLAHRTRLGLCWNHRWRFLGLIAHACGIKLLKYPWIVIGITTCFLYLSLLEFGIADVKWLFWNLDSLDSSRFRIFSLDFLFFYFLNGPPFWLNFWEIRSLNVGLGFDPPIFNPLKIN